MSRNELISQAFVLRGLEQRASLGPSSPGLALRSARMIRYPGEADCEAVALLVVYADCLKIGLTASLANRNSIGDSLRRMGTSCSVFM